MTKNRVKTFLYRVLCGFFLGVSVITPGVSGSIMAIMAGIYRDLINIVSNPFKNFKRNFFYLLPMGVGALLSLVLCVKLLSFAFEVYPAQSQLLFIGLIAGGLLEVTRQVRRVQFKLHYVIAVIITSAIALAMGLAGDIEVIVFAGEMNLWYLCVAGFVAGVASLVPGMSVSLILMLFGVYSYLLTTASGFAADITHFLLVAGPVGLCFLVGMVLFSKVIKFVFDRYPGFAYFAVFGFMCGTLVSIFPNKLPADAAGWASCILLFLAGLMISVGFQLLGKRMGAGDGTEESPVVQG